MTKKKLMEMGFTEEQANQIIALHNESTKDSVAKHLYDGKVEEIATLKQSLKERDEQVKSLKKFEGDSKALQDKLEQLEKENKEKEELHNATLKAELKKNAVKFALLGDEDRKPQDLELIMGLVNLDSVKVDETGSITEGFKEQYEKLVKEKGFLFAGKEKQEQSPAWNPTGVKPKDGNKANDDVNNFELYGKELAKIKLQMMGIQPSENNSK